MKFRQNTKRIIAGSLIVWLSGVIFLFCCEPMKVQASENESCPLAKTHNSCYKTKTEDNSQFSSIERNLTLDCCKFLPQVFDKARKNEKIQKAEVAAAIVKISAPKLFFAKHEYNQPKVFKSPVLERGNTYLKNCVFRI